MFYSLSKINSHVKTCPGFFSPTCCWKLIVSLSLWDSDLPGILPALVQARTWDFLPTWVSELTVARSYCYGLNGFVSPKYMCWSLTPNVMALGLEAFRRHEKRVLTNRTSALIEETSASFLSPSVMWGHGEKMAICEPGSKILPDTKPASTLFFDF